MNLPLIFWSAVSDRRGSDSLIGAEYSQYFVL